MQSTPDIGRAIGTIDHVVIVVDHLERSAAAYRRLGFTLSPKGVHSEALGTENHTLMLRDDYFELLAVRAPTERNTYWRKVLDQGGGVGGMAMATVDPAAAHAYWLSAGLSPEPAIRFARAVPRPDGSTMEARFEVVSLDEIPGAGMRLFVCSQPTREAVWLPELLRHANTAVAIDRVVIGCPDLAFSVAQWLRALPAATAVDTPKGVDIRTGRHRLSLVRSDGPEARALGIDYRVADLEACRAALEHGGVPYEATSGALRVAAAEASNVAIGFLADA